MLSRLAGYLERSWEFPELIGEVKDTREWSGIPTSSVYLSCFGMFALRLRSFNALEEELRLPLRWERWVGTKKPSADTLGYALARMDLDSLRQVLVRLNHEMKRKKILKTKTPPYLVAAVDGNELFRSRKRCCPLCLQRVLETGHGPVTEYYHRVAVLQIVNASPPLVLDLEPVLPGEDEVAAAERMLARAKKLYPRFFDILTLDALYLRANHVQKILNWNWDAVIVLKQEGRELYQDVDILMPLTAPEKTSTSTGTQTHWDLENLPGWRQLGKPIRVVCSSEVEKKRERIAGLWQERPIVHNWRWATTIPRSLADASRINQWGHSRWDIETRGFMELTQYWGMDHCFHHHPNAITACLLILMHAFALTTVFFERNLKLPLRQKMSRLNLARLLAEDLAKAWTGFFWSQPP